MIKKFPYYLSILLIFLTAGLSSCKQYTTNLDDFLSYWSSQAAVVKAEIKTSYTADTDGYPSLVSDKDAEIILTVRNPKQYQFLLPTASERRSAFGFANGVRSAVGSGAPKPDTDYTVSQLDDSTLKLVFKKEFLQANEHGAHNLNPEIVLWSKDGRKFSDSFTFKIRANSPPPALEYRAIVKTKDADGRQYYVLCFAVKDMDKKAGAGGRELLHKDIAALSVTAPGGGKTRVALTVSEGSFDVGTSNGFLLPIANVNKLEAGETDTGSPDEIPTGNWILYVKTGVEVGGGTQEYAFQLLDGKGLSGAELKASTATNKLPPVRLYHNEHEMRAEDEENVHPIPTGSSGAAVSLEVRAKAGAAVSGTIEKKSGSSWTSVGTVSGTTAATVTLPALGGAEQEAVYRIRVQSRAAGYTDSGESSFYVKVTKEEAAPAGLVVDGSEANAWKKLKEAVAAAEDGDSITINGEIKATGDAGNSGEIVINKNLTIEGKNPNRADILNANSKTPDGNAPATPHRIFNVEEGKKLTLKNLTLKNGKNDVATGGGNGMPGNGGAVCCAGDLEIDNVLITECQAVYFGGGVFFLPSLSSAGAQAPCTLVIKNTDITHCEASGSTSGGKGGGIFIVENGTQSDVKITDVKITNNKATTAGAGFSWSSNGHTGLVPKKDSAVLEKVTIEGNELTGTSTSTIRRGGAGISFVTKKDNTITLKECTIKDNKTPLSGGGIMVVPYENTGVKGTFILEDCELSGNEAENGGGAYIDRSNMVIKNTELLSNKATQNGGGVYLKDGTYTMSGSVTVTPSTGNDANLRGKNDIYLPDGKTITITGTVNPAGGIAGRITPETYTEGTVLLSGAKAQESKKKFTITRETSGGTETGWGLTDGTGNDAVLEKTATTFGEFTDAGDFTKIIPPVNGVTGHDPTYPLPAGSSDDQYKGVFRTGRTVKLSPYTIGKTAVTYKLWKEVYDWAQGQGYTFANPGAKGTLNNGSDLQPVVFISWRDCIIWCNAYTEKTKGEDECVYRTSEGGTVLKNAADGAACDAAYPDMDKKGYRLPTEAEWEYAARWQGSNQTNAEQHGDVWLTRLDSLSGATKPVGFSGTTMPPGDSWDSLRDEALRVAVFYKWWGGSDWVLPNPWLTGTVPVGSKDPNYLGLYDMSGNVHDYCFDWFGSITSGSETNPQGPSSGTQRVGRGGNWTNQSSTCAVGNRGSTNPGETFDRHGFRLACRP